MTELQPTEIELTAKKKKKRSLSKRKIAAVVTILILIAAVIGLTVILAHRASRNPQIIQPVVVPAEEILPSPAK
jgi:flagellar basal body-associated protein FliL